MASFSTRAEYANHYFDLLLQSDQASPAYITALGRYRLGAPLAQYDNDDLVFLPRDQDRFVEVGELRRRCDPEEDIEVVTRYWQGPTAVASLPSEWNASSQALERESKRRSEAVSASKSEPCLYANIYQRNQAAADMPASPHPVDVTSQQDSAAVAVSRFRADAPAFHARALTYTSLDSVPTLKSSQPSVRVGRKLCTGHPGGLLPCWEQHSTRAKRFSEDTHGRVGKSWDGGKETVGETVDDDTIRRGSPASLSCSREGI